MRLDRQTDNQPTNLVFLLCPFSYSTLLCSSLLCYFLSATIIIKTTVCLYSSPVKETGLVGRRTSRSVPKRNRLFERSSEPAVISLHPPWPCARYLPLRCRRPAYYSALLVALSLAQPSPAQPLKQSINHSILALAPRRRLSLAPTGLDCYWTSRTKGDGKPPLYTQPVTRENSHPFQSPSALKLNWDQFPST